jgi:flagellar biogenesis protein FliO
MSLGALAFPLLLTAGILVLYAIVRMMRTRLGIGIGTVSAEALKIVGKRQLDQRKALYVVEVADRYILIGAAENSISLIDHIGADEFAAMADPPKSEDDGEKSGINFSSLLQRAKSANALLAEKRADAKANQEQASA